MNSKQININSKILFNFCKEILLKLEVPEENANLVSDIMVETDLRGVATHGVVRLPIYAERIIQGLICPIPKITVIKDSNAIAVIDANHCLGQISSYKAMELAINKAKNYSVGIVSVKNSNHFGAAASYTINAVNNEMIGFTTTNANALLAPSGGIEKLTGNNPFSYAIPAGEELPIVLDMACSVVAAGKILLKRKIGEEIPLGWALSKDGKPTTNAYEGFEGGGSLLPIGEYKGYGIALIMDILSGVLSGGAFGTEVQALYDVKSKKKLKTSHFFLAINVDKFRPIKEFKANMDQFIRKIKNSQRKEGISRIYLPGEIEFENKKRYLKEGIPLALPVIIDLEKTAKKVGVSKKMLYKTF